MMGDPNEVCKLQVAYRMNSQEVSDFLCFLDRQLETLPRDDAVLKLILELHLGYLQIVIKINILHFGYFLKNKAVQKNAK